MEKGMTEMTDLVFSKENEERMEEESVDVDAKQSQSGKEEEKNSGGIFNSFISSLVSPSSPKVRDEANNGGRGGDERERSGDGDGGLIDNLVSHLPSPLADDAAPATEEASILIHSIVHD